MAARRALMAVLAVALLLGLGVPRWRLARAHGQPQTSPMGAHVQLRRSRPTRDAEGETDSAPADRPCAGPDRPTSPRGRPWASPTEIRAATSNLTPPSMPKPEREADKRGRIPQRRELPRLRHPRGAPNASAPWARGRRGRLGLPRQAPRSATSSPTLLPEPSTAGAIVPFIYARHQTPRRVPRPRRPAGLRQRVRVPLARAEAAVKHPARLTGAGPSPSARGSRGRAASDVTLGSRADGARRRSSSCSSPANSRAADLDGRTLPIPAHATTGLGRALEDPDPRGEPEPEARQRSRRVQATTRSAARGSARASRSKLDEDADSLWIAGPGRRRGSTPPATSPTTTSGASFPVPPSEPAARRPSHPGRRSRPTGPLGLDRARSAGVHNADLLGQVQRPHAPGASTGSPAKAGATAKMESPKRAREALLRRRGAVDHLLRGQLRPAHGSYWHDMFGHRMSHGCVNLSPKRRQAGVRARGTPTLLPGWLARGPRAPPRTRARWFASVAAGHELHPTAARPSSRARSKRTPRPADPSCGKGSLTLEARSREQATPQRAEASNLHQDSAMVDQQQGRPTPAPTASASIRISVVEEASKAR